MNNNLSGTPAPASFRIHIRKLPCDSFSGSCQCVKYGPDQNDELSNTSTNRPCKNFADRCGRPRGSAQAVLADADSDTDPIRSSRCTVFHRIVTLVRGPHETAPSRRMAEHDRRRLPRGEGQTARARGPLPAPGSGCVRVNFEVDKGAWPSVAGTGRATAACRPRPGREPQAAAAPDTAGAGRPRPLRLLQLEGADAGKKRAGSESAGCLPL